MDLDKNIGLLIKLRRKEKSMTQQELASKLGITYQQVQKYESGINRIRASLLMKIADVLGVDIMYFFQDLEQANNIQSSISDPYTLKIIEILNSFESEEEKEKFAKMVSDMAKIISGKNE